MDNNLLCRLWLAIGLGPTNRRINQLLEKYIFPETVYDEIQKSNPGLADSEYQSLKNVSLHQAEYLYMQCFKNEINIYCPEDEAYPKLLLEIDNPPNILFTYGKLENIRLYPSIAVIGARDADDYAMTAAEILSSELASQGVTIVSGFARGIDSAAHHAAINSGGQTVAVLGCGLEYDYPRNSSRFKKLISQNGAVVTEYFPSAKPAPENFKIRNRIVSGLSNGILVIQAGDKSGTLNTASHAISQGRDIFAVPPHDIFSGKYRGNSGLLRDGAIPVYSVNDILNNLQTFVYD